MKIKIFLLLLLAICCSLTRADAATWKNPFIMPGAETYDTGDPQILKFRGEYYMYCSTGKSGIYCWRSRDLVNWSDAIEVCNEKPATEGYAPEVKYWNGVFYMVTSPSGQGHYILTSDKPTGPFTIRTSNLKREIDGTIFMDDDGKWYFYHAGFNGIEGNEMPTHLSFGTDKVLNACMDGQWTEGPGVVKHNGKYYLIYTGNHVLTNGYRIDYAVSNNGPLSTYTPQVDQNPILISADGIDNLFGVGHGSAFIGPDLDSYFFCYHNMYKTPIRHIDIDRIAWNGDKLMMLGPTTWAKDVPAVADNDYFDRAEIGDNWKIAGGNWSIKGADYLKQSSTDADAHAVFSSYSYNNYTAEFTVRLDSASQTGRLGAIFSCVDASNYSEALLNTKKQELELVTVRNGAESSITSYALPDEFSPFVWHSIRLEKNGTSLKAYVDGLQRADTTCADNGGTIGYVAHNCATDFSYIAISKYVSGNSIQDVYFPVPGIIPASLYNQSEGSVTRQNLILSYGNAFVEQLNDGGALKFNLNVRQSTDYIIGLRYMSANSAHVHISVDGEVIREHIALPASASEYRVETIHGIALPRGKTTLTIEAEDGTPVLYEMNIRNEETTAKAISDNFDGSISSQWKHREGVWTISNNQLLAPSYGKIVAGTRIELGLSDYAIECDVTPQDGIGAGIIFRVNNPSIGGANDDAKAGTDFVQGYYFGLTESKVVLYKLNYGRTLLKRKIKTSYTYQKYHLKVIVKGDTIQCFLDNMTKPYIEYTDPLPFISGRVGLRTDGGTALFDNFSMTTESILTRIKQPTISPAYNNKQKTGIYTISGQCVGEKLRDARPGVYIVEGRKVINK